MPRVPTVVANDVALRGATGARYQAVDFGSAGEAIGASVQRFGGAIGQAADTADHIQTIAEEARAKDHDNRFVTRLRVIEYGDAGFYTTQNADTLNARKPTEDAIEQAYQEALSGAKSPREKRMLSSVLQTRRSQALEGVGRYAQGQAVSYAKVQSGARQSNAIDDYVRQGGVGQIADDSLATLKSEISAQASLDGLQDAGVIKAMTMDAVTKAHAGVVQKLAVDDPLRAMEYFENHRDDITPGVQLQLDRMIHPALVKHDAESIADLVGGQTLPAIDAKGPVLPQMFKVTALTESGNRDFTPGGRLVTSPKGAQGAMQTMPSTQRDPGFGIRPARDGSVAEKNRVGRDYLTAMMARYGNDPARAWAAYNAGPGRVDAAIKEHGAGWLSAMPAETKGYVSKNMKAIGGGFTQGVSSDDLGSQIAAVDRIASARGLSDETRDAARSEVERRHSIGKRVQNEREDQARDAALTAINNLPLGSFTDLSQLGPASAGLSPATLGQFREMAASNKEHLLAGTSIKANGDTAFNLNRMAEYDPEKFKAVDLRMYKGRVTDGELDSLAHTQAQYRTKSPASVDHGRIWATINRGAIDLGLDLGDSKGKARKPADRMQAMSIFTMVNDDLRTRFKDRQPSDDEVQGAYDRAVRMVVVNGNKDNPVHAYEAIGTSPAARVPDAARQQIMAAYQRRYRRPPTEGEMLRLYEVSR